MWGSFFVVLGVLLEELSKFIMAKAIMDRGLFNPRIKSGLTAKAQVVGL